MRPLVTDQTTIIHMVGGYSVGAYGRPEWVDKAMCGLLQPTDPVVGRGAPVLGEGDAYVLGADGTRGFPAVQVFGYRSSARNADGTVTWVTLTDCETGEPVGINMRNVVCTQPGRGY